VLHRVPQQRSVRLTDGLAALLRQLTQRGYPGGAEPNGDHHAASSGSGHPYYVIVVSYALGPYRHTVMEDGFAKFLIAVLGVLLVIALIMLL
jgi:hypothetical protein